MPGCSQTCIVLSLSEDNRGSRLESDNAINLPSSENRIHYRIRTTQEAAFAAEGQFVNYACHQAAGDILC